jgi:hypothetical protein
MKLRPLYIFFALIIAGCSSTKYVSEGQYLLNKVKIVTDNKGVNKETLDTYLRQTPNQRVFGTFKLQLGVYNLSGRDTTNWWNNWLKRAGEKPVIFDETAAAASCNELRKEMVNRGYAKATVETTVTKSKKRANLVYHITTGKPYKIQNYQIAVSDDSLSKVIHAPKDSYTSAIRNGMNLDINVLNKERVDLAAFCKQRGYYNITKENFRFKADTTIGELKANVALKLSNEITVNDSIAKKVLAKKKIRNITFLLTTSELSQPGLGSNYREMRATLDSAWYDGYRFLYTKKPLIAY